MINNTAKQNTSELDFDNEKVISSTGYRTLLIFRSLLENDLSLEELGEIVKDNAHTGNAESKDTVRICLNTLRNAGCDISRPSKTNNFKYHLVSHPFTLTVTNDELNALLELRDNLPSDTSWKKVLNINNLYAKIIALTQNYEQIQTVGSSAPLFSVKYDIISSLSDKRIYSRRVIFKYNSPESGIEDIEVCPSDIVFSNKKLYLKAYIYKYGAIGFLNTERILSIVDVGEIDKTKFKNIFYVVYRVFGESAKKFECKDYEEILNKTDEYIEVKASVANEFCFTQRLLLFGADFKIVLPSFFKEKLLAKLKKMRKLYENEEIKEEQA